MSVRKRSWKTSKGVEKTAWIVDYTDGGYTNEKRNRYNSGQPTGLKKFAAKD